MDYALTKLTRIQIEADLLVVGFAYVVFFGARHVTVSCWLILQSMVLSIHIDAFLLFVRGPRLAIAEENHELVDM